MIGSTLDNRFHIFELIGEGGLGQVYLANQLELNRTVAVKVLYPTLVSDSSVLARFEREGKVLSQLHHNDIPAMFHFGVFQNRPYIAMEYMGGDSLRQMLEKGPLATQTAIDIVSRVCLVLQSVHVAGFVHRDLKPENILVVEQDKSVKLIDFGLAGILENNLAKLTESGAFIGSLNYVSPEQCLGHNTDLRTDIYALGCILHECLTGEPPFSGSTPVELMQNRVANNPQFRWELASKPIPDVVRAIVAKSLSKEPKKRFQSARELWHALQNVSSDATVTSLPEPEVKSDRKRWVQRSVLLVVLFIVCVISVPLVLRKVSLSQPRPARKDSWQSLSPPAQLLRDKKPDRALPALLADRSKDPQVRPVIDALTAIAFEQSGRKQDCIDRAKKVIEIADARLPTMMAKKAAYALLARNEFPENGAKNLLDFQERAVELGYRTATLKIDRITAANLPDCCATFDDFDVDKDLYRLYTQFHQLDRGICFYRRLSSMYRKQAFPDIVHYLIRLQLDSGNLQSAQDTIRDLLLERPEDFFVLNEQLMVFSRCKQFSEETKLARKLVDDLQASALAVRSSKPDVSGVRLLPRWTIMDRFTALIECCLERKDSKNALSLLIDAEKFNNLKLFDADRVKFNAERFQRQWRELGVVAKFQHDETAGKEVLKREKSYAEDLIRQFPDEWDAAVMLVRTSLESGDFDRVAGVNLWKRKRPGTNETVAQVMQPAVIEAATAAVRNNRLAQASWLLSIRPIQLTTVHEVVRLLATEGRVTQAQKLIDTLGKNLAVADNHFLRAELLRWLGNVTSAKAEYLQTLASGRLSGQPELLREGVLAALAELGEIAAVIEQLKSIASDTGAQQEQMVLKAISSVSTSLIQSDHLATAERFIDAICREPALEKLCNKGELAAQYSRMAEIETARGRSPKALLLVDKASKCRYPDRWNLRYECQRADIISKTDPKKAFAMYHELFKTAPITALLGFEDQYARCAVAEAIDSVGKNDLQRADDLLAKAGSLFAQRERLFSREVAFCRAVRLRLQDKLGNLEQSRRMSAELRKAILTLPAVPEAGKWTFLDKDDFADFAEHSISVHKRVLSNGEGNRLADDALLFVGGSFFLSGHCDWSNRCYEFWLKQHPESPERAVVCSRLAIGYVVLKEFAHARKLVPETGGMPVVDRLKMLITLAKVAYNRHGQKDFQYYNSLIARLNRPQCKDLIARYRKTLNSHQI